SCLTYVLHLTSCTVHLFFYCFLTIPRPPIPPLFPYTTLFRSLADGRKAFRQQLHDLFVVGFLVLGTLRLGQEFLEVVAFRLVIGDRKSTRLNSSHGSISYAVFCLKKKIQISHY